MALEYAVIFGSIGLMVLLEICFRVPKNSLVVFWKSGWRHDTPSFFISYFGLSFLIFDALSFGILSTIKNFDAYSLNLFDHLGGLSVYGIFFGLLIYDFFSYFSHRLRHSNKVLWNFHRMHHSAEELGSFVGFRAHPVDYVVRVLTIHFPVAVVLGPDFKKVMAVVLIREIINVLTHSRLPVGYGPFERLFVSPKFHQAHHRKEGPAGNFGSLFSVWDGLFGTTLAPASPRKTEEYGNDIQGYTTSNFLVRILLDIKNAFFDLIQGLKKSVRSEEVSGAVSKSEGN